ncbi:hypothetical protein SAMN04487981_10416 [Streptomyces sp. cf386]|nr:hypothetical protein SAMN04487981_10416 [Streptomyces sp. cf386]
MDDLLKSEQVAGIVADQQTVLTAVHAYTVERSVPVIRVCGGPASARGSA